MFLLHDTIAALASAAGPGGRGIIRVSGPDVLRVLNLWYRPGDQTAWANCKSAARHPGEWDLQPISRSVAVDVYLWPNRRSYTGQPQAELHAIGSPPILEAILGDLFSAGARPAQAGEFTLRAFLAGRVDLLQAEAVLGVIDAGDQHELQTALTQLAGGISHRLVELRTELLDLLADLEAGLDFTDEGLEFVSRSELTARIVSTRDELQRLLTGTGARARHSARPRVVIAGPPNAGKSTLFNALVERSAALVSPIAGTTRDYLRAEVEWHGVAIELVDTAGWEQTTDAILQAALELRAGQLQQAELVLQCRAMDDLQIQSQPVIETPVLHLFTKSDMVIKGSGLFVSATDSKSSPIETKSPDPFISPADAGSVRHAMAVSALTGFGLELLKARVVSRLQAESEGESHILGSTAARCRDSLERAIAALTRAAELADVGGGDEFLATDVREALEELGKITGAIYTDDLLDRIFSKFCIGK